VSYSEHPAPTTQVVIKHELHPVSSTMVFVIPPTISEHNIMIRVLERIRRDYPGAWAVAQQHERVERGTSPLPPAKVQPFTPQLPLSKIKATTREHLGLPAEEPLPQDVPL
jgi:hypothetical protein